MLIQSSDLRYYKPVDNQGKNKRKTKTMKPKTALCMLCTAWSIVGQTHHVGNGPSPSINQALAVWLSGCSVSQSPNIHRLENVGL